MRYAASMVEEAEVAAVDARLRAYMADIGDREPALFAAHRQAIETRGAGHMQVSPAQGQFMALAVMLMQGRRGIEVGVFAGYSTLWLATAVGAGGHVLACDRDAQITGEARAVWQTAGLAERIELRLGGARATLEQALADEGAGSYDFIFIDADKGGYLDYYELGLQLVRSGGLIMADNTLWYTRVADPACNDADTEAIRAFNRHVHDDGRVDLSVLALGDGLTVARRR